MSGTEKSGVVQALDKLYEFEREPVSDAMLQPGRHFAGLFAGEHVAGTEFVIGALFVGWGASAFDIFVGLALGNVLAVLTWTFICAPIAVRTRLTLYWYLRRVAGPATTTVYNVLNAFLYCILAGCMITVSASAIRIPLGISEQKGWVPDDIRFVLLVFVIGAVVVAFAIFGFKRLAQFSEICSPWMFLMFVGGALVMLPILGKYALDSHAIRSFGNFWQVAQTTVWRGEAPPGQVRMSFWHIAAFAWICNLAMHGGLSDMALFRFAPNHWYGLYSSFGMFLGHYLAWICAGIMGAGAAFVLMGGQGDFALFHGTMRDKVDPGFMANYALGVSGLIAVVLAGWTTSNPTLYRAGLALQAITPGWPRWLVTLVAGTLTTLLACSPFVFTKLLDFVGLYGLLLMPVGAIVFAEHWIFPRIGFTQYWVARKKLAVSWPALASWGISIAVALALNSTGILHLFFLFVPVWLLTTVLYIAFAAVAGAREDLPPLEDDAQARARGVEAVPEEPRPIGLVARLAGIVALLSLLACIAWPAWLFLGAGPDFAARHAVLKTWLIVPSLAYFVAGTYWAVRWDAAREPKTQHR